MIPPIFPAVDVPAVQALLQAPGKGLRFYAFGRAPQGVVYPYAVWQLIGGQPENYVNQVPDIDTFGVQIDVYATQSQGADMARNVAEAVRDAIEPVAHITAWTGEFIDPDTKNHRFSFDSEWIVNR